MLGMIALTSLMTFAFCAASIFSNLTVKMVFSFGFSSAGASEAAAGAAAAGAVADGMAISVMLSRSFSAVTSSETSRRVKEEMESTIGAILGEMVEGPGWSAGAGESNRRWEEENDRHMLEADGRIDLYM